MFKGFLLAISLLTSLNAISADPEYLDRFKNKNYKYDLVTCSNCNEVNKEKKYIIIDLRDKEDYQRMGSLKGAINVPAFYNNGDINEKFIDDIQKYLSLKQNILFVSQDGHHGFVTASYFDANNVYPVEKMGVLFGGIRKWYSDGCDLESKNGKKFNR